MWYIEWREPAFAKKTGYLKYTDCDAPAEAILPRCYIRGRSSDGVANQRRSLKVQILEITYNKSQKSVLTIIDQSDASLSPK